MLRQRVLRVEGFQLQQQAFAQIARADSDGIEVLHDGQRIVQVVLRILALLRQLFDGGGQVAVFVEIADDAFGDFLHGVGTDGHAELPGQVIGEPGGRRQKFLERGPLGNFALLRLPAVAAGIQILIEESCRHRTRQRDWASGFSGTFSVSAFRKVSSL